MSNNSKRRRQITILDCFGNSKRTKNFEVSNSEDLIMNSNIPESSSRQEIRELLASAAEKRIMSNLNTPESDGTEIDETELDSQTSLLSFNNSEELFHGDLEDIEEWHDSDPTTSDENEPDMSTLVRSTDTNVPLPKLTPTDSHTILFRPHLMEGCSPRPFPDMYKDRWDSDHVRMPCSPLNRYPVQCPITGEVTVQNRWELICQSLSRQIETAADLEKAIMHYNRQYIRRWDFGGLHTFLNKHLNSDQRSMFFHTTLPGMIEYALQLPFICTKPIPLLKRRKDHAITMSQRQVVCLLANAFFCTFPKRNKITKEQMQKGNTEYMNFPHINFNKLFIGTRNGKSQRSYEKLKCLLNYFARTVKKEPTGTVTYHRQHLQRLPNWSTSTESISETVVCIKGLIEDQVGMLQVDFANRFVGGGVLGQGCVQEEIRFVISPELIISRLFTESLDSTEVLIVTGVEQYSKYTGYADTFLFDADYVDTTPRDSWGRRKTEVVAMDATHYRKTVEQYKLAMMKRELNKAFVGFYKSAEFPGNLPRTAAVATGNWGCGAFRGSTHLKFFIQLMAASESRRGMLYFTFGNRALAKDFREMYQFLKDKNFTVGKLWAIIVRYAVNFSNVPESELPSLFDFVYRTVNRELKDTSNLDSIPVSTESKGTSDSTANTNEPKASAAEATEVLSILNSFMMSTSNSSSESRSACNSTSKATEAKPLVKSSTKWPDFMD